MPLSFFKRRKNNDAPPSAFGSPRQSSVKADTAPLRRRKSFWTWGEKAKPSTLPSRQRASSFNGHEQPPMPSPRTQAPTLPTNTPQNLSVAARFAGRRSSLLDTDFGPAAASLKDARINPSDPSKLPGTVQLDALSDLPGLGGAVNPLDVLDHLDRLAADDDSIRGPQSTPRQSTLDRGRPSRAGNGAAGGADWGASGQTSARRPTDAQTSASPPPPLPPKQQQLMPLLATPTASPRSSTNTTPLSRPSGRAASRRAVGGSSSGQDDGSVVGTSTPPRSRNVSLAAGSTPTSSLRYAQGTSPLTKHTSAQSISASSSSSHVKYNFPGAPRPGKENLPVDAPGRERLESTASAAAASSFLFRRDSTSTTATRSRLDSASTTANRTRLESDMSSRIPVAMPPSSWAMPEATDASNGDGLPRSAALMSISALNDFQLAHDGQQEASQAVKNAPESKSAPSEPPTSLDMAREESGTLPASPKLTTSSRMQTSTEESMPEEGQSKGTSPAGVIADNAISSSEAEVHPSQITPPHSAVGASIPSITTTSDVTHDPSYDDHYIMPDTPATEYTEGQESTPASPTPFSKVSEPHTFTAVDPAPKTPITVVKGKISELDASMEEAELADDLALVLPSPAPAAPIIYAEERDEIDVGAIAPPSPKSGSATPTDGVADVASETVMTTSEQTVAESPVQVKVVSESPVKVAPEEPTVKVSPEEPTVKLVSEEPKEEKSTPSEPAEVAHVSTALDTIEPDNLLQDSTKPRTTPGSDNAAPESYTKSPQVSPTTPSRVTSRWESTSPSPTRSPGISTSPKSYLSPDSPRTPKSATTTPNRDQFGPRVIRRKSAGTANTPPPPSEPSLDEFMGMFRQVASRGKKTTLRDAIAAAEARRKADTKSSEHAETSGTGGGDSPDGVTVPAA